MNDPADTPEPPYYAVIFTSVRAPGGEAAYAQTAEDMNRLAALQPGYLGMESAHDDGGLGITVSYWQSLEAIAAWKAQADHQTAQRRGQDDWYRAYSMRIALVERAYDWTRAD
jgi:heme-degrading monooxygenase HmoA